MNGLYNDNMGGRESSLKPTEDGSGLVGVNIKGAVYSRGYGDARLCPLMV